MNEKQEIADLTKALEHNLQITRLLSERIGMLENQVEENAAQRMSVMLLLRALVECSPNREQVAALSQRIAAQMNAQEG